MIFKEIIEKNKWEDVKKTLLKLKLSDEKNLIGYKKVFETLKKTKSKKSDMEIVLRWCSDKDEKRPYVHISGRKIDCKTCPQCKEFIGWNTSWAIEFTKWAEWLGMKISLETEWGFPELTIIAHCLWEMTFCGFKEKQIQNHIKELHRRVGEIKKDIKNKKLKR